MMYMKYLQTFHSEGSFLYDLGMCWATALNLEEEVEGGFLCANNCGHLEMVGV